MPTQPETQTILLVEDETLTAKTEKMQLEKYGYVVRTVTTGEKAVEALKTSADIDLILMDTHLGDGMDGTEAAELILRDHDIPIVFLSSHTEPEIVEKTEKTTSYGYVVKSSSATVLDASIKMAFKLAKADRRLKNELTERERSEKALAEKTKLLEGSQVLANLGSWEWDIVHDTWYFSDQWKRIHGLSDNDLTTSKLFEIAHPDDAPDIEKAFADARERGKIYDIEHRIIRADDKEIRHIKARGEVEFDQKTGRPVRMVGVSQDITERKQAKNALIESEKRYKSVEKAAELGIWEMDIETGDTFWSDEFFRICGYEPGSIISNSDTGFSLIHNDDKDRAAQAVTETIDTGKPYSIEKRIVRPDGEIRWVYSVGEVKFDENGTAKTLVGSFQDITDRKLAQEEIQKQLSEKETLLREVHHRVKNNIAHIENLLSLQAGSTANAEVKAALQDAISRVESMRVLYDKLLVSKDLGEISIKDYLESLLDSLVVFFDPDNRITVDTQLVDFAISAGNAVSIGIIINELVTNVFKYAFGDRDNGMVSISLDNDENRVTLTIQDNGVGIDERAVQNKSPGFGLTIVKMLVEQFDGTYSSVSDHGTKSVVQLKL